MSEEQVQQVAGEGIDNDVGIGLQDIANAVRVIDIATERGAIRGAELSSVGAVRDRLAAFIDSNNPQPAPEGGDAEPPAVEGEEEAEVVDVDIEEPTE